MIKSKFWAFAFLVLVLMAANFFYTSRRSHGEARTHAENRLSSAERALAREEAQANERARSVVQLAARLTPVSEALRSAVKAGTAPTSEAFAPIPGALGQAIAEMKMAPYTLLILANNAGATRYENDTPTESGLEVPDVSALVAALGGEAGVGLHAPEGGGLLRTAAAPVIADGKIAGAVLLGWKLDDEAAKEMAGSVGADVTYLLGQDVIASSRGDNAALAANAQAAVPRASFGYGEEGGNYMRMIAPLLGLESAAGYGRKLPLAGAEEASVVVATDVRSELSALEQYVEYQLMAVALFLLVALVWSFFVAQGGYGTPKQMARDLQRAAGGDLRVRLPVKRYPRPFRKLAEVINALLEQAERRVNPGVADQVMAPKGADISAVLGGPESPAEAPDLGADEGFPFGGAAEGEGAPDTLPPELLAQIEAGPYAGPYAGPDDDADDEPLPAGLAPVFETSAPEPAPAAPAAFNPFEDVDEPAPAPTVFPEAAPSVVHEAASTGFPEVAATVTPEAASPVVPEAAAPGEFASFEPPPAPDSNEEPDGEGGFFSDSTRVMSLDAMAAATGAAADPFSAAMSQPEPDRDYDDEDDNPDATVVARVPDALLQATARSAAMGSRDPDEAHFRDIFQDFVNARQRCGEPADGLTFEKFATKLRKNRDTIKDKHGARSVRFQVYVKDGKAALKATPVK